MNILCWNCRGLGNPWTVRQLRRWVTSLTPDILFLSKTKISNLAAERIKDKIGYTNAIGVASNGLSGGLCIMWNNEMTSFTLTSFSQNHISGEVISKGGARWRFVGVYGWPEEVNKPKTWDLLRSLCGASDLPTVFGGDFNEILEYGEKEGGSDRERRSMAGFRRAVEDCSLGNLRVVGQWYTWERGLRSDTRIRERLDRFLVTMNWNQIFPDAFIEHLVRYRSYHAPILLRDGDQSQTRRRGKVKQFRFESGWLLDEGCERVVQQSWEETSELSIQDRLSVVGKNLLHWSKKRFSKS